MIAIIGEIYEGNYAHITNDNKKKMMGPDDGV
jgi:hypothetical protein